jgi:hypothetical protein
MSIDKKGFKYRLSNVLTWVGSAGAVFAMPSGIYILIREFKGYSNVNLWEEFWLFGLTYLGCAVINYLMVGSLRLLPWRKLDE